MEQREIFTLSSVYVYACGVICQTQRRAKKKKKEKKNSTSSLGYFSSLFLFYPHCIRVNKLRFEFKFVPL